jgi:hypothetical protein
MVGIVVALAPLHAAAQVSGDPVGNALSFADPERMAQLTGAREHAAALAQAQAMVDELRRIQARDGQIDADALIALSQQYAEPLAELLPATQVFLQQVNAILTPDQRTKFQQMLGPAALLGGGG